MSNQSTSPTLSSWNNMWDNKTIGWHLGQLNPVLKQWGEKWTSNDVKKSILFPLCGKTLDMLFFSKLGHKVTGIEGIPQALDEFAKDNAMDLQSSKSDVESFEKFFVAGEATGNNAVELYLGDFFAWPVDGEKSPKFDLIFDRGSLVAINPALRDQYVQRLYNMLNPGAKWMIASIEYDQNEMSGPPNSLGEKDVKTLLETLKTSTPEAANLTYEVWDRVDATEAGTKSRFLKVNGGPLTNLVDWVIVISKP